MQKNATPKVSVVMPLYNAETFVLSAVESILNQTYTNFELLVVNDGSTDESRNIVSLIKDSRIKLIDQETNMGLVATLNRGFSLSSGEFIARMDSDDISRPDRLEKQVHFLEERPEVVLVGSWFEYICKDVVIKTPVSPDEIKYYSLFNSPFGHPTVMLRKSALSAIPGPYNKEFFMAEDYELWCRLIDTQVTANIPEVLLDYRIHAQQISAQSAGQKKVADRVRLKQFRKMVGFSAAFEDRLFLKILDKTRVRSRMRAAYQIWFLTVLIRALLRGFLAPRFVVRFWKDNRVKL